MAEKEKTMKLFKYMIINSRKKKKRLINLPFEEDSERREHKKSGKSGAND